MYFSLYVYWHCYVLDKLNLEYAHKNLLYLVWTINQLINDKIKLIITANDALKKLFAKCRDGKIRVLKVSIENGMKIYFF